MSNVGKALPALRAPLDPVGITARASELPRQILSAGWLPADPAILGVTGHAVRWELPACF